jgi:transposase-like protein
VAKAVAKVVNDRDALLALFDYAAEHWPHLWTTNPIESTFSPVWARTRVTKCLGQQGGRLAMVFKLLEAARAAMARGYGPDLVALARAGGRFRRADWSSD